MAGESDTNEPTMEEKLQTLDFIEKGASMEEEEEEDPVPLIPMKPPTADSVHVRLKQALHTDDHAVLLQCLYTRDEKVISNTTSNLTPADVLKLLKSLISMTQLRGAVLVCVLPWLRSVLSQHASSIASQESSLTILNSLYQLIQSRISTLGTARQLSTCLDVLSVQIPDDMTDDESTVPAIIYEDRDSDSDEDEDDEDAMDTEEEKEEFSDVIDSHDSDGSEVISD